MLHYLNNGSANLSFIHRKEQFFVPVVLILKVNWKSVHSQIRNCHFFIALPVSIIVGKVMESPIFLYPLLWFCVTCSCRFLQCQGAWCYCARVHGVTVPGCMALLCQGTWCHCAMVSLCQGAWCHCARVHGITVPGCMASLCQGAWCHCARVHGVTVPGCMALLCQGTPP